MGAKEGCAEGECGACSVLVARPGTTTPTRWTALNACLVPVLALDGQEVVTAEGLGTPDDLHPVQHEMAVRGGSQCGYCTPGFVCSMAAEFYRPDRAPGEPSPEHGANGFDLHALSGNLCRCTGYRPIRDAAYALASPAGDDELAGRQAHPPPRRPRPTSPGSPGPPTWPPRWPCWPSTPTRSSSRAPPTTVSRSTCAACGPPRSSRSTGSPSCAGCR